MMHICKEEHYQIYMKLIKNQFISEGVQNCYFWVVANLNICSIQFVYCYRFNHFFSMFLFNTTEIIRNFQNFVMISGSIERKYLKEVGLCYREGSSIQYVRSSRLAFRTFFPLLHTCVLFVLLVSPCAICTYLFFCNLAPRASSASLFLDFLLLVVVGNMLNYV